MLRAVDLRPHRFLIPWKVKNLIRLGNDKDGGYVVDEIGAKSASHLFSFGLGNNVTFERDFIKINEKAPVLCYDHTTRRPSLFILLRIVLVSLVKVIFYFIISVAHLLKHDSVEKVAHFKKQIMDRFEITIDYIELYKTYTNENFTHIKKRVVNQEIQLEDKGKVSLNAIVKEHKPERVFIKIDIEGDEYLLLEQLKTRRNSISGLVIEFHDISKNFKLIEDFVESIRSDLILIHIHANNGSNLNEFGLAEVMELTFANSNLCVPNEYVDELPNDLLDFPNSKNHVDFQYLI